MPEYELEPRVEHRPESKVKTPKSRSNVRTREQDEFTDPELKARVVSRACRARVSLPSRDGRTLVQFECDRSLHSDNLVVQHTESGRIRLRNGKVFTYNILWQEVEDKEVWREEAEPPPARVRLKRKLDLTFRKPEKQEIATEESFDHAEICNHDLFAPHEKEG